LNNRPASSATPSYDAEDIPPSYDGPEAIIHNNVAAENVAVPALACPICLSSRVVDPVAVFHGAAETQHTVAFCRRCLADWARRGKDAGLAQMGLGVLREQFPVPAIATEEPRDSHSRSSSAPEPRTSPDEGNFSRGAREARSPDTDHRDDNNLALRDASTTVRAATSYDTPAYLRRYDEILASNRRRQQQTVGSGVDDSTANRGGTPSAPRSAPRGPPEAPRVLGRSDTELAASSGTTGGASPSRMQALPVQRDTLESRMLRDNNMVVVEEKEPEDCVSAYPAAAADVDSDVDSPAHLGNNVAPEATSPSSPRAPGGPWPPRRNDAFLAPMEYAGLDAARLRVGRSFDYPVTCPLCNLPGRKAELRKTDPPSRQSRSSITSRRDANHEKRIIDLDDCKNQSGLPSSAENVNEGGDQDASAGNGHGTHDSDQRIDFSVEQEANMSNRPSSSSLANNARNPPACVSLSVTAENAAALGPHRNPRGPVSSLSQFHLTPVPPARLLLGRCPPLQEPSISSSASDEMANFVRNLLELRRTSGGRLPHGFFVEGPPDSIPDFAMKLGVGILCGILCMLVFVYLILWALGTGPIPALLD